MEMQQSFETDLNFKATELRLGLPGTEEKSSFHVTKCVKRTSSQMDSSDLDDKNHRNCGSSTSKAQVVGWPPVRSYRKNCMEGRMMMRDDVYVKVSMDGAPYLRKIDIKVYKSYPELLKALGNMFTCTFGVYREREGGYDDGSEYVPTYEDKDDDWMLVGDVPWEMFITSCKRLRIIKGSDHAKSRPI